MGEFNWVTVDPEANIRRAQYDAGMAKPYCLLIEISEDCFLAYSPGVALMDSVARHMPPDSQLLLLAPSAGHTMGLDPWHKYFKNSRLFAAEFTRERLLKNEGIEAVESLDALRELLPAHIKVVEPATNGNGEVWVSVDNQENTYWAVCDAIMNLEQVPGTLLARLLKKIYGLKPELRLHRIFRLGLKDKAAFLDWATEKFSDKRRNILLPCHGEIDDDPELDKRLLDLLKEQL